MTVFLVILAILILLNILPIGARVIYDENGIVVRAVLGLIQVPVVPGKPRKPKDPELAAEEKRRKQEKKAAKKAEKQKKKTLKRLKTREKPAQKAKPLGAKLQEFLPLIKLGIHAVGDLCTVFTVRRLCLRVTYGGEDAGKAAMNYGIAWGICGTGMALLTKTFRIKKYDVQPVLDYSCRETRITADACVTLTLGRVMIYLIGYGIKALKILRKNKEKAVQQHESSST